jgi:hypothetical protein
MSAAFSMSEIEDEWLLVQLLVLLQRLRNRLKGILRRELDRFPVSLIARRKLHIFC